MEQRIDAKGLACPKPVILAKKAMDACGRNDVVLITVDNEMAVENLRKLAACAIFTIFYAMLYMYLIEKGGFL